MKVTVVGTGYVGLVTGACLSEFGNQVMCLDVDPRKIEILQGGGLPIHEPGLLDIVQRTGLPPVAPGTYPLAATALPALNLSSLSTGVAVVLWNSVAGSYVDSDAKLLDAERSGNAIMMLERAAAIELARERGASSLPAGIPDTLELVDNAEAYRSFLAPIEIATPGATLAAAAQVVNALSVPYTRSSARGDWLLLDGLFSSDCSSASPFFSAHSRQGVLYGERFMMIAASLALMP